MSEKRSSALLLYDIFQSVEKIEEFTRGISFDQMMADERTKDAVLRNREAHRGSIRKPDEIYDRKPS